MMGIVKEQNNRLLPSRLIIRFILIIISLVVMHDRILLIVVLLELY